MSNAVTAAICASASEAALLVASFMPLSLDLGATRRGAETRTAAIICTRNTPRRAFASMSPHSANVDPIKVEQYCGGILTRLCCSRVSRQIVVLAEKRPDKQQPRREWPVSRGALASGFLGRGRTDDFLKAHRQARPWRRVQNLGKRVLRGEQAQFRRHCRHELPQGVLALLASCPILASDQQQSAEAAAIEIERL